MHINKIKIYVVIFILFLILSYSYSKLYGLYNKYDTDKENKEYKVVVVQYLGEDESKVKYLVKLRLDSFILNIYKVNKFDKSSKSVDYSKYIYGDELEVRGKIVKAEVYGNPRRI